jgi:hypothetical protein
MTHEEYNDRKECIYQIAVKRIRELDREFAESNILTKNGDIVEDSVGKIKVTGIVVLHVAGNEFPCVKFKGMILRKDGKPRKDKKQRWVYSYIQEV